MKADEPAELVVDIEKRVARVIVKVEEIDIAVKEPLEKLLLDAAKVDVQRLEIDLSAVSFADSHLIKLALKVRDRLAPRGAQVAIKAPSDIRRLFDATGTSDLFEIVEPA